MTTAPSLAPVYAAFINAQQKLEAHVRAKFPRLCCGHIEDAVSAVGLALVTNPTYYKRIYDPKDPSRLIGLFKCVALRAARGTGRRRSYSAERAFEHEDDMNLGYQGTQQLASALNRDLQRIVRAIAQEISPPRAKELAKALIDQLVNGGTDGEVAKRHGLPREYVCRGRSRLTRHFVGEPRTSRRRAQKTV